jgi:hypothetical protein
MLLLRIQGYSWPCSKLRDTCCNIDGLVLYCFLVVLVSVLWWTRSWCSYLLFCIGVLLSIGVLYIFLFPGFLLRYHFVASTDEMLYPVDLMRMDSLIAVRKQIGKHFPAAVSTQVRIVLDAVRVVSKKSRPLARPRTSWLKLRMNLAEK